MTTRKTSEQQHPTVVAGNAAGSEDAGGQSRGAALAKTLAHIADFENLPEESRLLLQSRFVTHTIARGTYLVRQGEAADTLFVVLSGRFTVELAIPPRGGTDPTASAMRQSLPRQIAEICAGELIGEIAFFTGKTRTADVRAVRDSVVASLSRSDFDAVAATSPSVWQSVVATLADRLAKETRRATEVESHALMIERPPTKPRTVALIGAADRPVPPAFLTAFMDTAPKGLAACFLSAETLADHLPGFVEGSLSATAALNALEDRFDLVVFIADAQATAWSETVIRNADQVMLITTADDGAVGTPGALETLARAYHHHNAHRMVIIHDCAQRIVFGTAGILAERPVFQHHHVAVDDLASLNRLWRFLTGTARGFIACGGGAFAAAHIGIFEAASDLGFDFDLFVGTSGGAAMAGAFAQGATPDDVTLGVHRMFVEGRALGRYALPRYGALDHTHFDAHLRQAYSEIDIEDLWLPYCAVAADLSDTTAALLRSGPLWQAIRASAAIPGLLPPFYTPDGRMLVDGSVIANVPLKAAQSLKQGPNLVVSFRTADGPRFPVDYARLPGRREVFWKSLFPATRRRLPEAPSAANVLVRSLMADRDHFERHLTATDLLIVPPVPVDMGALDWRRHRQLRDAASTYAAAVLQQQWGKCLNRAR